MASPTPNRRISAKKRTEPRNPFNNSVNKIRKREVSSRASWHFGVTNHNERFRHIQLQEELDTHDPKAHNFTQLPFLRRRSKITEIVSTQGIIFALTQSGICAAFNRGKNEKICYLNLTPDEAIRSMFLNKHNDSLITVSVSASDNFSSLSCRSTRIEYIMRGKPNAGFTIFQSESLKFPGFVEFDDVNGKVLTYSDEHSVYKMFDLKNYTMLYSISEENIEEIKISPGIMLLIFRRCNGFVPLKILSIEDGTVLKSFDQPLHRTKKIEFIEQFNENLLVKQEKENLKIVDIQNFSTKDASKTEFLTPAAFVFLYERHMFLTFRGRTVAVWNFHGQLVTYFEDHLLYYPDGNRDSNTNNIYITNNQDLIISYCKSDVADCTANGTAGSINISDILTGKLVAKIQACNSTKSNSRLRCNVNEVLDDITALYYDEDQDEIYTGNSNGFVHLWSN